MSFAYLATYIEVKARQVLIMIKFYVQLWHDCVPEEGRAVKGNISLPILLGSGDKAVMADTFDADGNKTQTTADIHTHICARCKPCRTGVGQCW